MVINQVHDGRPVASIAAELGLNPATVHRRKKQDRIDQGLDPSTPPLQSSGLRGARGRIRELETDLTAMKIAAVPFEETQAVRPKDLDPVIATMWAQEHQLKTCCRGGIIRLSVGWTKPPHSNIDPACAAADVVTEIWERSRRTYGWLRVRIS